MFIYTYTIVSSLTIYPNPSIYFIPSIDSTHIIHSIYMIDSTPTIWPISTPGQMSLSSPVSGLSLSPQSIRGANSTLNFIQ